MINWNREDEPYLPSPVGACGMFLSELGNHGISMLKAIKESPPSNLPELDERGSPMFKAILQSMIADYTEKNGKPPAIILVSLDILTRHIERYPGYLYTFSGIPCYTIVAAKNTVMLIGDPQDDGKTTVESYPNMD